jgi:hypothetical protein
MIRATSAAVISAPSPSWLVSKFWQNTQRKLDQPKKIVPPEPILFAEMRKRARDPRMPAALAHPDLVVEPVDLAVARTNAAGLQRFDRLFGALLKSSLLEGF